MGWFNKLRRLSDPRPRSRAQSRAESRSAILEALSEPPGEHERLGIIVAGMEGAGKKALVTTFCTPETPEYDPHGPYWDTQMIQDKLGISQELSFSLANGQSLFENKFKSCCERKEVAALVLVYDVSNRDSFTMLSRIRLKVMKVVHSDIGPPMPLSVIALKSDLPQEKWEVTAQEGKQFAEQIGAQWGICSARKRDGLDDVMIQMAKSAVKQKPKKVRDFGIVEKEAKREAEEEARAEEEKKAKYPLPPEYQLPLEIIDRSHM